MLDLLPDLEPVDYIERKELQCEILDNWLEKKDEWETIDDLVFEYQKQYTAAPEEITDALKAECDAAASKLIETFYPLFKKYLNLIKTGQINFENVEQKMFVLLFIEQPELKRALYSSAKMDRATRAAIFQRFNFVKETYGNNDEEDIITDLHMLFLILARRYKKMDRSFCCYVYNSFRYEVARHIQKFIGNPLNIHYRNVSYEKLTESLTQSAQLLPYSNENPDIEDHIYTNEIGLPDVSWIQGVSCSDAFLNLTPLERKILAKYYLEHYNDRQIAKEFGLHLNSCNTKRHKALMKLVESLGVDKEDIKRTRNSGLRKQSSH